MLSCQRFLTSFFAALLLIAVPVVAQEMKPEMERKALIIANSHYINDTLEAAIHDGAGVNQMLVDAKYNAGGVVSNVETKEEFLRHWKAFLDDLHGGLAVFYFTGHGAEVDGDSMLLPTGIRPDEASETRLLNDGISLKRLFADFKKRQDDLKGKAQLSGIFIIDACRTRAKDDRPIVGTTSLGTKSPINGKESGVPITPPAGLFVFYATSAHQVAHTRLVTPDPVKMSVYTRTLLEQFAAPAAACDPTKGCSLQLLARLVRWNVHAKVDGAYHGEQPQTPVYFDALPLPEGQLITLRGDQVDETKEKITRQATPSRTIIRKPGFEIWECEDCPHLVFIPVSPFRLGEVEPEGQEAAKVRGSSIPVTIAQDFAIGMTDVTVAEFRAYLAGTNDGTCPKNHPACAPQKAENPVTGVSWNDAQKYVGWLNGLKELQIDADPAASKTGYYRLPTEAEFEFAARGKSTGRYAFGDDERKLCLYGNGADQDVHQITLANNTCSDGVARRVAVVKSFKPNEFGLYDVHGNVWKWVADCWTPSHDPKDLEKARGGMTGKLTDTCRRVAKGGSWLSNANALRLANRVSFGPDHRHPTLGFRVVRVLPKT